MNPDTFFSALANHLWQSTAFAGLAAALAMTMRENRARTRYWLWLIASLKFLMPFSLLTALGTHLSQPEAAASAPAFSLVFEQVSQPFSRTQVGVGISGPVTSSYAGVVTVVLCSLWACGFTMLMFSWMRQWRRIRSAVREGTMLPLCAAVPVVSTPTLLEPGIFGIFEPVLLLPQGITERLAPAHLEAIVAHELCHVRHRDNLAAAIHMLVEAVFWFHPLVWWLGVRLVEERERACDEEVLGMGNEPEMYAESILKTCEFYLESPLTCVSGVTGSDLKKRIKRIMTQRMACKLAAGKKLLLTAAGLAAIAAPVVFGVLHAAPRVTGPLDTPAATATKHSFEVATIKPNTSSDQRVRLMIDPSGRFNAEGVALRMIIEEAYDIKEAQLIGAPGWLGTERYTIQAKADDAVAEEMRKANPEKRKEIMMEMIRGLMEERCKLALKNETRDLPIYSMVVGKEGPRFHESAPLPTDVASPSGTGPAGDGPRRMSQGIRMNGRGDLTVMAAPLDLLANVLSRQLGRPVVNNTGLKGAYDFGLKWTPDEAEGQMFKGAGAGPGGPPSADAPPPTDAPGPSLFTAMQEQLGLKLESKTAPMRVLVIDHVEKPSEN